MNRSRRTAKIISILLMLLYFSTQVLQASALGSHDARSAEALPTETTTEALPTETTAETAETEPEAIQLLDSPVAQGLYAVYQEDPSASLGSFTTLKAAVDACNAAGNGSYTIIAQKNDLEMGEAAVIRGAGKRITLTSGTGGPYVIRQTISDVHSDSLDTNARQRHICLFDGDGSTTLTLENVILEGIGLTGGGGKNGGVRIGWGANLVVGEDAIIRNCYWDNGGGIGVVDGTVTVDGGTVINNKAEYSGGGIHASSRVSLVVKNGGSISKNTAIAGNGGGVFLQDNQNPLSVNRAGITDNIAAAGNGGGIFAENAQLILTQATITGNHAATDGGGIRGSGINATLENTTINQNTADYGAGVSANKFDKTNSTITMQGGSISSNRCAKSGGGVNIDQDTIFILADGEISQNEAKARGAGMFCTAGSEIIVYAGEISGNITQGDGGGIFAESTCALTLGGQGKVINITGNHAQTGAGIYTHSPLEITGASITKNEASVDGGGIYAKEVTMQLNDVTITENQARIDGGGIRGTGVDATLKNSIINNNKAAHGGGISFNRFPDANIRSNVTMDGVTVNENESSIRGGGVNIDDSTLTMQRSTVNRNQAETGGGVIASLRATFTMLSGEISNNTASTHGGGLRIEEDSHLNISSGEVRENTANGQGGGVYMWNTAQLNMDGGSIDDNIAGGDGGGVFTSDLAYIDPLNQGYQNITMRGTASVNGNKSKEIQEGPRRVDIALGFDPSLLNNDEINYYPEQTSLTYHPNGGTGSEVTKQYGLDSTINLEQPTDEELSFLPASPEYEFKHWNTQADGGGTSYAAGAPFKITEPTTLYAIWGLKKGTISGYVFQDMNKNGVYEKEELLAGRVVTLYQKDSSGKFVITTQTATTDANGWYQFEVESNETYKVSFKLVDDDGEQSVGKTGFIAKGSTPQSSHVDRDGFSDAIFVANSEQTYEVNAGYAPPYTPISGIHMDNIPWIVLLSVTILISMAMFVAKKRIRIKK